MKTVVNILLFSIVPLISIGAASWYMSDIDAEFIQEVGMSATEVCQIDELEIQNICEEEFYDVRLLRQSAAFTMVGAIVLILSFSLVARVCGTNRNAIAGIFPVFVPIILLGISLIVLVQGVMLTYSVYWIQLLLISAWYPVLTGGVGLAALLGSVSILNAIYSAIKSQEHQIVNGKLISKSDSPKLFSLVSAVAKEISANPPQNIVLGLDPNFYAINNPVKIVSEALSIRGETLYLSLPLLRILDIDEFKAVVGHELGHFVGKDTDYSRKFAPVYASIQNSYSALIDSEHLVTMPAAMTLGNLLDTFDVNVKKIGREREHIADQFGAKASSGNSLITALLKIGVYSNAWNFIIDQVIYRIKNGFGYTRNISWLFSSVVEHNINSDTVAQNVSAVKDNSIVHPNDSHPPTSERAANLGIDISQLPVTSFLLPKSSCVELIDNILELEEELTHFQQLYFSALGLKEGEADNSNYTQKIVSMYAAFITLADGRVESSEIEMAEAIGLKLFDNFDYFDFREFCHYPDLLPEFEKLLEVSSDLDTPFKETIYKICHEISKADGDVSTEEIEYLERIKSSLNIDTQV